MDVQNGKSVVLNEAKVVVLGQDDFKNYLVELDMMRSGPNENNWDFQNVAEYAQTFVNQPILIAYEGDKVKHYRVDKMMALEVGDSPREGADHFENFDMAVYSKQTFGM